MENHGGIVVRQRLGSEKMDAFSEWNPDDDLPYIVNGTDKGSAVRSRWDTSHEVGHLILHRTVPKELFKKKEIHSLMEQQANRFASAFLLPETSFPNELEWITLDSLLALKEKWRVSVGAMIVRCEQLGLINRKESRLLHINRTRRGWRNWEPLDNDLPVEEPQFLLQTFDLLFEHRLTSPDLLEYQIGMSADVIEDCVGLPRGYLSDEPQPPTLKMFPS
jgi:Zn-dependent peptidase ImmA (M78 family)